MIVARSWDASGKDSVLASSGFRDSTSIEEVAAGPAHGYTILRTCGPGPHARRDLHIAPTGNLGAMRDFVVTSSQESAPSIAPSGDAVAYESNETGQKEIYARSIPGPGARVQISADGGEEPVWSRDGRTLYYRTAARTIVAATIRVTPGISVAARRVLFADVYQRGANHASYDVMADGRLLFMRPRTSDSKVMVAVDWVR